MWLSEGDLPGEDSQFFSHFWVPHTPAILPGERVYIVAHDRLRGYAPLIIVEDRCTLWPQRACLLRRGGAMAVTLPRAVRGFNGFRYRFWEREEEVPFPEWQTEGVS